MTSTLETFVCLPLATKLTRDGCGARHARAHGEQRGKLLAGGYGAKAPKLHDTTCHECAVGRAHRAGEKPEAWPDGTPLEFVTITLPAASARAPKPPPPPTSEERARSRPAPPPPEGDGVGEPALREPEGDRTTTTAKGGRVDTKTIDCGRCGAEFTKTHGRQKYCEPCRPLAAMERKATPKKRASRSTKKAAGERLNKLFDEGAGPPASPPRSALEGEQSDERATALAAMVAEIVGLEAKAANGRGLANQLAEFWRLPLPFPEDR